ncbi:MAG: 2-nitropropane dioxygenase [Microbacterium sp. SCN 70-200]|uniref:NAD(P)H-dependent flavin oxidoreductase n=1 Tax=unclassified Microbacterium TaxID=2609290 RepID=UPI00086AF356|nr:MULTISPECIES: nitronate monooxygenase [unclassified Microbacterium]MBN9213713.1 nitronate monooxygenase [Microbacterium sp.]ODT40089.1 MAG: 2-nitropropane dioxygenase [Microbacterium sp. SCN 70-200]OJV79223.1 MAG: 2-nitropropane dioxygenase [Microbacterium sp. 70-16]
MTLRELLGIRHPIVLGPFGGLSSIELTAAVSDAGGLGSYGLYGYDAERIHATVGRLRAVTDAPFALNLWLPTGDEVLPDAVDLGPARAALAPLFEELGVALPAPPARFLPDIEEQLAAVLEARPAALSVVYGVPSADLLAHAHARDIVVIGTATTVAEAIALADAGVDAVVATGAEAAGHRVSFLRPAEQSLVGTFALVPQVVDAVDVPVIAAGGIADRRGVAAAFALGASGVQVGTAFLRTRQSAASAGHRAAIAAARDDETVLTRAMSGRLARGIPNAAMAALEREEILPFPAQNWLTGQFRTPAAQQGRSDLVSQWAGQAAGISRYDDVAEVFADLAAGLPN